MIRVDEKSGAVLFSVRVSPGASKTRALGEHDGALKVAVNAPPEKGKANKELVAFLAAALGVKKGEVSVAAGEASRTKRIAVLGVSASVAGERLAALCNRL